MKINYLLTFILSLLFISLFSNKVLGQRVFCETKERIYISCDEFHYGRDTIDKIKMVALYRCRIETDTTTNNYAEYDALLEIGNNISKFYGYKNNKLDSIVLNTKSNKNYNTHKLIGNQDFAPIFYDTYFQNYPKGKLTFTTRLAVENFQYTENKPSINWTILDSTTTFLGYKVQAAICSFKGRDYFAWFSSEIPVSLGPWKFSGLPGLIVSIKDNKDEYSFELKGIEKKDGAIYINKYDYISINSKQYYKMFREININYKDFFTRHNGNSGMSSLGSKNIPMNFNPIEIK